MAGPETFAQRRERLRSLLADEGVDAILVTNLVNVRYLTGFTGSHAAVLVASDHKGGESATVIATDGRYATQVREQSPGVAVEMARSGALRLAALAAERLSGRLAFESSTVTVAQHELLVGEASGIDLVGTRGLVEGLRIVKDATEIAALEAACGAADRALARLLESGALRPGESERRVARKLEWLMHEEGAEGIAFETIVASGASSAVPHHRPTDALIERGDLVKMDFGAEVGGYHSDMTRTVVVGAPPEPWQRRIHDIVREAQHAGREASVEGALAGDIDGAARAVITAAGHGDDFVHSTGHGVGLEIHEAPSVARNADSRLLCNTAITVEPGIYLPGRGGVRIEDTVIITPAVAEGVTGGGGPAVLTTTTRELLVI
ncbi:aminopeptidase P family protein [Hoyosella sp. G463]|uniref:Aminopeptidase P family protein n=2 Tax=Lolliginicoccus lacisalsi TaxID=2742202 RepID=A0A927JAW0_9ACTN|nr:aminopeptidase P family protein [Lolliginicoccus lacisalsi]MBD8505292.1 aminopeptidase P family protein [Lolliginicoccus lacisalsi]